MLFFDSENSARRHIIDHFHQKEDLLRMMNCFGWAFANKVSSFRDFGIGSVVRLSGYRLPMVVRDLNRWIRNEFSNGLGTYEETHVATITFPGEEEGYYLLSVGLLSAYTDIDAISLAAIKVKEAKRGRAS